MNNKKYRTCLNPFQHSTRKQGARRPPILLPGQEVRKIPAAVRFVFVLLFLAAALLHTPPLYAADNEITVAALGDCVVSRKISTGENPAFLELVELLRRADCTYGNCETTLYDPDEGFPAWKKLPGPHHFCRPWGADELKWMGIDLVSLANDHMMDFAYRGLFSTLQNLDRVGIVYAGAGKDLEHAAQPGYIDTAGGRVGLVSSCSSIFEINSQASPQHPHLAGRPGINPLNVEFSIQVKADLLKKISDLKDKILNAAGIPIEPREIEDIEAVNYSLELRFVKGDQPGFLLSPLKLYKDSERILAAVKRAKNNSRLVLAALHEHRGCAGNTRPSKFQEEFARQSIDKGADMFVGTGSHVLWGLEIYQGKPIFHGLGNFLSHEIGLIAAEDYEKMGLPADTLDPMSYAAKFGKFLKTGKNRESIVPLVTFSGENKIKKIELYPIVLENNVSLSRRGTPRLAEGEKAAAILSRFKEISAVYGTEIVLEKGVGMVVLKK